MPIQDSEPTAFATNRASYGRSKTTPISLRQLMLYFGNEAASSEAEIVFIVEVFNLRWRGYLSSRHLQYGGMGRSVT